MLLGFLDEKGYHTYIVPLRDFHFYFKGEQVNLFLELVNDAVKDIVKCKPTNFMLTVSDDPYMTWVGDWNHLGCSRFNFTMNNSSPQIIENKLQVVCHKSDFNQDIVLAERFNTWQDQKPKLRLNEDMTSVMESYVFTGTLDEPILFLKTNVCMNMHATVMNLYGLPHTKDVAFVAKKQTEKQMIKNHFDGNYVLQEDYTLELTKNAR
jgi:hypothetical protein